MVSIVQASFTAIDAHSQKQQAKDGRRFANKQTILPLGPYLEEICGSTPTE